MRIHDRSGMTVWLAILFAALLHAGCSSDPGPSGPTGGPVMGAVDMHCAGGATLIGLCMTGNEPTDAAAPDPDAGAPTSDYGETLHNAEGDDDDCKYHIKWTATPIRQKTGVTFTVTLTKLADGTPATEAGIHAEVFLSDTHPVAPPPVATESAGGKYAVGPITFDSGGDWTVRYHFYEDCNDAPEDSPHGHAAFLVHVP